MICEISTCLGLNVSHGNGVSLENGSTHSQRGVLILGSGGSRTNLLHRLLLLTQLLRGLPDSAILEFMQKTQWVPLEKNCKVNSPRTDAWGNRLWMRLVTDCTRCKREGWGSLWDIRTFKSIHAYERILEKSLSFYFRPISRLLTSPAKRWRSIPARSQNANTAEMLLFVI